jgi:hypothetical protein
MQPLWVRALAYGTYFWVAVGLHSSLSSHSRGVALVISLGTAAFFGLLMGYQGRSTHASMTGALAGLPATAREEAIAAVKDGGVPGDQNVRHSAFLLGKAYLRLKSDAELDRPEWGTWLLLPIFCAMAVWLAASASSTFEFVYAEVLGLAALVLFPLALLSRRRMKRNLAGLRAGHDSH